VTKSYLQWVAEQTPTQWWHDSADEAELDVALAHGAAGVTTNPVLISAAFEKNRLRWVGTMDEALARRLPPEEKAEALMRAAVTNVAAKVAGVVCAQVNPARAGDREAMRAMATRVNQWAPNIAVKLPATAAGLDVLEDCVAGGMTTTATVSFTVPQVLAIAERHRAGITRARASGIAPGKCFAVIMVGRLDDYLREVAHDQGSGSREQGSVIQDQRSVLNAQRSGPPVHERDLCQAGLAVAKRAYALYRERRYETELLVAALRGTYHLTELVGASLVMSIHPAYQELLVSQDFAREARIDRPVAPDVIERLSQIPDFVRAYEPGGMTPPEFITFGATQRTLSQFTEVGWKRLEALR
jgi:transaldolase